MNRDDEQRTNEQTVTQNEEHHSFWRMNRRKFLATSAASGAAAGIGAITGIAHAQDATPTGATPAAMNHADMGAPGGSVDPLSHGLVHFSPPDAAIIEAAASRLIPTDKNGPGAKEAGVVYFIDRQLARESRGYTGPIYNQGPFTAGTPMQGDQSALSIPDRFRLGIAGLDAYAQQLYSQRFVDCSGDQQDRILKDLENDTPEAFADPSSTAFPPTNLGSGSGSSGTVGAGAFFALLLEYVKAGFFADPIHGGNRDMVGWKLIGFPGAQMGYAQLIEKFGEPFTGEFKSLADYQGQLSGGE